MEQGGFFDGVPLSSVKNARFIDKAGAFFTMAKLLYNGIIYDFTGGSGGDSGSVVVDPDYLTWRFVAPDGMFDISALEKLTLSEMLLSIADTEEQTPIKEWEDFAAFMAQPNTAQNIQTVFEKAAYMSIRDVILEPPVFQPPENFPAFLRWLASISGEAGKLNAIDFRIETGFEYPISLYATKGVDIYLSTPTERPDLADGTAIVPNTAYYTSGDGMFDKPVLVIAIQTGALFFAYEQTVVNSTEATTLESGWYLMDSETNEITPYDLAQNPIYFSLSSIENPQNLSWSIIRPFVTPVITGEPDGYLVFTFQV